jgi:hypothetical protein
VLSATNILLVLGIGEKHGILQESIAMILWIIFGMATVARSLASLRTTLIDIGTDSEDDRQKELELLPSLSIVSDLSMKLKGKGVNTIA